MKEKGIEPQRNTEEHGGLPGEGSPPCSSVSPVVQAFISRREFAKSFAAAAASIALPGIASDRLTFTAHQAPLRVNGTRLNQSLTDLSRFGANPQGGVSRVAYSDADRDARAWVMELMRAAKLDPKIDLAGNIIARRAGTDASAKPIVFGSHIDSVPEGGNYDGDVGSLSAIEVARTLAEHGVVTRHPLEVVIFQNEEGGLVGSRAWVGELTARDFALTSRSGKTIGDGIRFIGGDPARIAEARRAPGDIAGYLELHIEQGGTLDREHIPIGVVEGIVGIGWWDVTITGFANHAGTTPMNERHDALLAAAKFIELVNRTVTSEPGRQVGTVGRIQALPGAPNVIPGQVVLSLELRDLDAAKIERLYQTIAREAERIGLDSGTTFAFRETNRQAPALSDPRVRSVIADAAKSLGLTTKVLPSGAGHDAQDMARLGPMGMIFVPSVAGISHAPRELTRPEDVVNGANVLLGSLLLLDRARA
jgi:beta-ureidopropionase / N-carbamoyl-L-amino-acid hydrolase